MVPQISLVGELEDVNTALVLIERSRQALGHSDTRAASDFVLTPLSANIEMLCKRQADHDRMWKAFVLLKSSLGRTRDTNGAIRVTNLEMLKKES